MKPTICIESRAEKSVRLLVPDGKGRVMVSSAAWKHLLVSRYLGHIVCQGV